MEDDFYSLCQILSIPESERTKSFTIWRFDTLYVRGLEKLDTTEVFEYFGKEPQSIVWLSTLSANVTFSSWQAAADSLLNLAQGLVMHQNEITPENSSNLGLELFTPESLKIPVPPNYRFIVGAQHAKAKAILIRFATINDVQSSTLTVVPGSGLKSQADGDRRRTRNEATTILARDRRQRGEMPLRMRMRADDEEDKTRKEARQPRPNDVWNRIEPRTSKPSVVSHKRRLQSASRRIVNMESRLGAMRRAGPKAANVCKAKNNIWRAPGGSAIVATSLDAGDLRNCIKDRGQTLRIQVNYDD